MENMESDNILKSNLQIDLASVSPTSTCESENFSNISYEEAFEEYEQQLIFLRKINNSKFPIFEVKDSQSNKKYAMKVFQYNNGDVNPWFINESRFSFLHHPNIIFTYDSNKKKVVNLENANMSISYILMELALCDFTDLIQKAFFTLDEKLARTYFHQLIDGLEYLHSQQVAHLDLKPENLVVGQDYQLRIIDFDLSFAFSDTTMNSRGTFDFRCPELAREDCRDPIKADIYSIGIILFCFRYGALPYKELLNIKGYNLHQLLLTNSEDFFRAYNKIFTNCHVFDQDFKELFTMMILKDPVKRASISDVKNTKWYNKPTYTKIELAELMKKHTAKFI